MKLEEAFDWLKRILGIVGAIVWILVALSVYDTVNSGALLKGVTYAPIEDGTIVVHNYDSIVVADGDQFFSVNDSASENYKLDSSRDLLECIYGNESNGDNS
jgi:hypothetical protein